MTLDDNDEFREHGGCDRGVDRLKDGEGLCGELVLIQGSEKGNCCLDL